MLSISELHIAQKIKLCDHAFNILWFLNHSLEFHCLLHARLNLVNNKQVVWKGAEKFNSTSGITPPPFFERL